MTINQKPSWVLVAVGEQFAFRLADASLWWEWRASLAQIWVGFQPCE